MSVLISKRNLITSWSTIKKYLKTKINSQGDEVTDFCEKEILKVDYSDTSLAAISWDFVLELLSACVFKLM